MLYFTQKYNLDAVTYYKIQSKKDTLITVSLCRYICTYEKEIARSGEFFSANWKDIWPQ